MTTQTWRDTTLQICPSWLLGTNGYRLMTVLGLIFDLQGTALDFGLRSKFPGINPEMTALIGRNRGIVRGPHEADQTYVNRLRHYRQIRKRGGNAFALLEQVQIYLYPTPTLARIVYDNGVTATLQPGGWQYTVPGYDPYTAPTGTAAVGTTSWDWDGASISNRFWVLLYLDGPWPSNAAYANDLTFNDAGLVEDAGTIGSTATPADISGLVTTVSYMTPPHASAQQIILCFSEADLLALTPGGNWDRVSNRNPNYEYINV